MPLEPLITVVVPCYDEQEVLPETHRRLTQVLAALDGTDYEILYVNDGSTDATEEILRGLADDDPRVRALVFSRNFGHQMATTAGVEYARGDAVVLIDADLQDPPEVIADMVAAWRQGADVAYGVRTSRAGETAFKRTSSRLFNWLINRLSEVKMPLSTGDFRLMDRKVVDALGRMGEQDRYIRGMVSWLGFRQQAVPFDRKPRAAGKTKYPLLRMVRFAADAVFSFSFTPLRLATWMGILSGLAAFAGIVWALAVRLSTGDWVPGWASLVIAVLFVGGVQLICIGILGEYVGRIYREGKSRPLYVVREALGFPRDDAERS